MSRRYELKQRAQRQAATRQRIVEAVVDLHERVGPARTTVSAIAEAAGVQRLTVYRHFPDEPSLLSACASHYNASNPFPDPTVWFEIAEPEERLRRALEEIYAYYRHNEPMLTNVFRDATTMPALDEILAPQREQLDVLRNQLAEGWNVRGDQLRRVRAAIGLAIGFHAWQSLARDEVLTDSDAVTLMIGAVRAAAGRCS